jgi:hypothetical protein
MVRAASLCWTLQVAVAVASPLPLNEPTLPGT